MTDSSNEWTAVRLGSLSLPYVNDVVCSGEWSRWEEPEVGRVAAVATFQVAGPVTSVYLLTSRSYVECVHLVKIRRAKRRLTLPKPLKWPDN